MTICEGKLCQNISEQTVATTLTLAEQHDHVRLKNDCIAFVSSQDVLDVVKETYGFKNLMRSCPWALVDILKQKLSSPGVCVIYARIFSKVLNSALSILAADLFQML